MAGSRLPMALSPMPEKIYIGETGYKDKWFPVEHQPIVDRKTFDAVREKLKFNAANRKARRKASDAILMGKLYDAKGNRMSPSCSSKYGVRYRFMSAPRCCGVEKKEVGSVDRVAAQELEAAVLEQPYGGIIH